jgi:hypothetical protein
VPRALALPLAAVARVALKRLVAQEALVVEAVQMVQMALIFKAVQMVTALLTAAGVVEEVITAEVVLAASLAVQ